MESLLSEGSFVVVRSPESARLASLLGARGVRAEATGEGTMHVFGATSDAVGEVARTNNVILLELSNHQPTLEQRYMELTGDSVDYRATSRPEVTTGAPST